MWDGYTVAMRRARLDGLHAAAIAAAVSFLLYLPVRAMMAGATLFKAPCRTPGRPSCRES